METKSGRTRLLIPDSARPVREAIREGDRVAFNGNVSPKALVNARGVVKTVTGERATVELEPADRRRVHAAMGKEVPESMPAPTSLLDKLSSEEG
jgi:hypothetical protein